jgi:hypothetical protein
MMPLPAALMDPSATPTERLNAAARRVLYLWDQQFLVTGGGMFGAIAAGAAVAEAIVELRRALEATDAGKTAL